MYTRQEISLSPLDSEKKDASIRQTVRFVNPRRREAARRRQAKLYKSSPNAVASRDRARAAAGLGWLGLRPAKIEVAHRSRIEVATKLHALRAYVRTTGKILWDGLQGTFETAGAGSPGSRVMMVQYK